MNCTFIDTGREKVLIETGIGEKWSEKETRMYGIFREKPFAESLFEITGMRARRRHIVINTHLHFDHAGGNTGVNRPACMSTKCEKTPTNRYRSVLNSGSSLSGDASGTLVLQCGTPHARYLVSQRSSALPENPHERDRASYLPENWLPLIESGQLELMPDTYEPSKA